MMVLGGTAGFKLEKRYLARDRGFESHPLRQGGLAGEAVSLSLTSEAS